MDTKIHEMKKVILHLHLDGALRPETVREWLEEDGTTLSLEDVKTRLMVDKDCKNLNEYLEKLQEIKSKKEERMHLLENKKEFLEKITEDKKNYTKQIEKIDILLNNYTLLKEEYYKRNKK